MVENLDEKSIYEFYEKIGISIEDFDFKNNYFNYSKKDKHLAWKPVNI